VFFSEHSVNLAGHILRLPEETPASTAMNWAPEGARAGHVV